MAGESKTTTDHKTIQAWAEARGGHPSTVKRTEHGDEAGVLRIDFPGYSGAGSLEHISWDEFFQKFDEKKLAFLYQEHTSSGEESRFFKLVSRDTAEHKTHSSHTTHESHSTSKSEKKEDAKESKSHSSHASTHKKEDEKESKAHTAHKSDSKESKEDTKESKAHASHKGDKKEDKKESKAHK